MMPQLLNPRLDRVWLYQQTPCWWIHIFFRNAEPADVGYRALATAISDLAATGAEPLYATLNLCIPENDENWLKQFSDGLF